MLIGCERNDLCADIEHDAANPFLPTASASACNPRISWPNAAAAFTSIPTVLVDATYEGDLASLAKASYRLGRESREEFGEPHAGHIYMRFGSNDPQPGSTGKGDKAIQSYCFRFSATADPANMVSVEKPEHYDRADYHFLLEDIRSGKLTRLDQIFGIYPMLNKKVEFNSLHPLPTTGVPSESLDLAERSAGPRRVLMSGGRSIRDISPITLACYGCFRMILKYRRHFATMQGAMGGARMSSS